LVFREPGGAVRWPLIAVILFAAGALAAGLALYLRLSGDEGVVIPDTISYTEALTGTWEHVNPLFAGENPVDQDLSALLFSGLIRTGPEGAPLPDLAGLPQVSEDGRTYTFRLRPNLRWHDGQPLTSRDVAFTITRIQEPGFRGAAELADAWAGVTVETPDAQTIVLVLQEASAPFLARFGTLGILPEHLLRGLSSAALRDGSFNQRPVGSGPYRLASLDSREAVLSAHDGYHGGRPAIDTFRLRFYPDTASALLALGAGEVDGFFARDTLSLGQRDEVARLKNTAAQRFQRAGYLVLYLNNDLAGLFDDPRVRKAIALTINREALLEGPLRGQATISSSPIPPATWSYAPEYDKTGPGLSAARALLREAGWELNASTAVLTREGSEFRFTVRTDNDGVRAALAADIARQLEPLGIRATVATTTFSVFERDFLRERRYDAAIAGWDQGADPDPYFGWHSSQGGTAGLNFANFADIVIDQLIQRGRTDSDPVVRREQYRQFQEKWDELAPSVVIAYPDYLYVHTTSLSGLTAGVLARPAQRFFDVQRWRR
jgi:peptide/nickel transport system substrate-binding protein